jgi:hypothetical protein
MSRQLTGEYDMPYDAHDDHDDHAVGDGRGPAFLEGNDKSTHQLRIIVHERLNNYQK